MPEFTVVECAIGKNELMSITQLSIRPERDRRYCTIARVDVGEGIRDKGEPSYTGSQYSEVRLAKRSRWAKSSTIKEVVGLELKCM
jgi:hypothetical protein